MPNSLDLKKGGDIWKLLNWKWVRKLLRRSPVFISREFFFIVVDFSRCAFSFGGATSKCPRAITTVFFFVFKIVSRVKTKQKNITKLMKWLDLCNNNNKKWSFSEGYSRSNAAAATSVCNHLPAIVCVITTIPYHPHFAVHFARPHPPLSKNSIVVLFCFVWRRKKEKC